MVHVQRFTQKGLPVVAVLAAVVISGCGKLSKSDARDLLQRTYYDKDDNIYCTWDLGHLGAPESRKPTSREFDFIPDPKDDSVDEERACVDALVLAGIINKKGEPMKLPFSVGGGTDYAFTLAKDVDFTKTGALQFPCGKKRLVSVDSVTTEGKKATLKYTRTVTRDSALAKKLDICAHIEGAEDGTHQETMKLSRDDDGNWLPDN